jgi:hypothetical protein
LELFSELCAAIPLFGLLGFSKEFLDPKKERVEKNKRRKKDKKKVKGIELLFSCIPCCLGV